MRILQKHALHVVGRIFRNGNLAHAWLLAGQEGTGKEELARLMAALLMCDNPLLDAGYPEPCGTCPHCGKLSRGTHPDLTEIEPDGAFIKLPQVHALQKSISFSPLEARNRSVLILHAHRMNREAANALLKTLEEPPDRTFLILTASSVNALLPTIVSRCQVISCGGLEAGDIADILCMEDDVKSEAAAAAARLSDGNLVRARAMLAHGMDFRNIFFNFIALSPGRRFSLFFEVSGAMSSSVDDFMLGVAVLRAVVRDMLLLKTGGRRKGAGLLNPDKSVELEAAASEFSAGSLSDYAVRLEKMERLTGRNINREMLANSLLVFWVRQGQVS